jgi:serine/threonine protein phosphatase PrpC
VDRLVGEANRRGGLDNITVVIVRVDTVEEPAGDAAQGAAAQQAQ